MALLKFRTCWGLMKIASLLLLALIGSAYADENTKICLNQRQTITSLKMSLVKNMIEYVQKDVLIPAL